MSTEGDDFLSWSDADRDALWAEVHGTCIVCEAPGHVDACPSGSCDLPDLVLHCRESMCRDCIPWFELELETGRPILGAACCVRCQGKGGDCCPDCEGAGWIYQADAAPERGRPADSEQTFAPN